MNTTRTVKLTSYVDDPNGNGYDDGIPKINTIDVGFYEIPTSADIESYMTSVDNGEIARHLHYYPMSYLSSEQYSYISSEYVDEDGIHRIDYTGLSSAGNEYGLVDNYCTLAPYVDRIIWNIEGAEFRDPTALSIYAKGCTDLT